ncbi:uncharacterized protein LOC126693936 [Quercus robur]|uniref:uncharacterized protein LOC126693936 n=1 Tax=Quercus robur TaxID=38942 RepID=UPI0021635083|nr:uncharacterized protein LOC126693936 [Quercus robur]
MTFIVPMGGLKRYAIQKNFILIVHSRSTSLSLFLHYQFLLSLAPSSFSLSLAFLSDHQAAVSPSLAFLSDHQAIAVTKPHFSLRSTSRCPNHQASVDSPSPISKSVFTVTKPRYSLRSPCRCHQASLFSPIKKPLFESPSLCLCRSTLTHLQIRFTVTELRFSLRSPSRCHQASLFSPITKPLSESPSLCLCLCRFTEASSVSQIKSKSNLLEVGFSFITRVFACCRISIFRKSAQFLQLITQSMAMSIQWDTTLLMAYIRSGQHLLKQFHLHEDIRTNYLQKLKRLIERM